MVLYLDKDSFVIHREGEEKVKSYKGLKSFGIVSSKDKVAKNTTSVLLANAIYRYSDTIADRIFKDSDGKWKVERNVRVSDSEDSLHPMSIPEYEVLPSNLQTSLDNIPSFKGSTYVYTEKSNDSIVPDLEVAFKSKEWLDVREGRLKVDNDLADETIGEKDLTGTLDGKDALVVMKAIVPKGVSLEIKNNSLGTTGSTYWVTDNMGTGELKTYAYAVEKVNNVDVGLGYITTGTTQASTSWSITNYEIYDITGKFSTEYLEGTTHIGTATAKIDTDLGSIKDYKWSNIKGNSSLTLSIITPNGTNIRNDSENLTLEYVSFYEGAEVQPDRVNWYYVKDSEKVSITKENTANIKPDIVDNSLIVYLEVMYRGVRYFDSVTINDISDPYQIVILGVSTFRNGVGSNSYTAKVYRQGVEIDLQGSDFIYVWEMYDTVGNKITNFSREGKSILVSAEQVDSTASLNCIVRAK